jgi:dinuclear metal center YbgI/SA1388 family protein
MTVGDVEQHLEQWAPKELAWERDNVGLILGSRDIRIRNIVVTLDVNDEVVEEAKAKGSNLIVTHHPLFFRPVRGVTQQTREGNIATKMIRYGISLLAIHTNIDFARGGVSAILAQRLRLENTRVLQTEIHRYRKIVVFVPLAQVQSLTRAMQDAGAGKIGNYDSCSFRVEGKGTFRPLAGSKPYLGSKNILEEVDESRLEMIVPAWKTDQVIAAMRRVHPYEEVAFYVEDLVNQATDMGAGIIGEMKRQMPFKSFLKFILDILGAQAVRYAGSLDKKIRRVAVCGGSGSDLLPLAVLGGADAFVTADVNYHTFQEAGDSIGIVDAGHFETENPAMIEVADYLKRCCKKNSKVRVFHSHSFRNPVHYYGS